MNQQDPNRSPAGTAEDAPVFQLRSARRNLDAGPKAVLRAAVEQELTCLSAEHRARGSEEACQRLRQQDVWQNASSILFYAPMRGELDITCLVEIALESGKLAALPQYDAQERAYRACQINTPIHQVPVGKFGIREPGADRPEVPLNQLDLVLVPGVAFDVGGRRLGRGRGFYDRLLAGFGGAKCGVGFDEQLKPEVPVEGHDILLDCMLTPTRWLVFGRAATWK